MARDQFRGSQGLCGRDPGMACSFGRRPRVLFWLVITQMKTTIDAEFEKISYHTNGFGRDRRMIQEAATVLSGES